MNIFRKSKMRSAKLSAHAYATDPLALHYAGRMLEAGLDREVEPGLRMFCYLPFEPIPEAIPHLRVVHLVSTLRQATPRREVLPMGCQW